MKDLDVLYEENGFSVEGMHVLDMTGLKKILDIALERQQRGCAEVFAKAMGPDDYMTTEDYEAVTYDLILTAPPIEEENEKG